MMGTSHDIVKLAEQRVGEVVSDHHAAIGEDVVLLAALEDRDWRRRILGVDEHANPMASKIAAQYLELANPHTPPPQQRSEDYGASWELGLVKRGTLIALSTAAIGASLGMAAAELHPILVSVAGAESAVILNILSALLLDRQDRSERVDGLDLAVVSILRRGHYSPSEVTWRISVTIGMEEIEFSVQKLIGRGLVEEGDWPGTYKLSSKGAELYP
jgi:hypothetical protein